jgi:ankyrin repeat domain-containing protein 17
LACCGGFTDVADFLIKAGADIELGASTPLMEAAQEGHLELVKYVFVLLLNIIFLLVNVPVVVHPCFQKKLT